MLNTPDAAGVFLLCLEKLRLYIVCILAVVWLAFLLLLVIGWAASNAINEVLVLESSIYDRHIIMRITRICYP